MCAIQIVYQILNVHLVFVLIQHSQVSDDVYWDICDQIADDHDIHQDDDGCEGKCVKEVGDIPQQVINSDETCCPSE